jgi:uncharacterized delta-60 repeat protein
VHAITPPWARIAGETREPQSRIARPKRLIALLALVVGLLAPSADAFGAGELDPTFSGDGRVVTNFGTYDSANGIAIQSDGKVVAAGGTSTYPDSPDFALARYNLDGSLDPTFDGDGKLVTDFGGNDSGRKVAVQPDGKIVVVGQTSDAGASNADFALARYNPNGSLDTSFDGDGKLVTDFSTRDFPGDVAIQADGKIVMAGSTYGSSGAYNFALARYNVDGSLDTAFDGDGKLETDFLGGWDWARAVAIQTNGKIVAAGSESEWNFALARYNTDGSLDASFSGDGKMITDFFGNYDEAYGVVIQADGKIVAAGYTSTGTPGDEYIPFFFGLARYNSNGSLDSSFSGDGKTATGFYGSNSWGADVAIQTDGKIVAAGRTGSFALVRYLADGSLDPNFDYDGRVSTGFGDYTDAAESVALEPDGKIVAAGVTRSGPNFGNFALARYLATGTTLPKISITDVAKLENNAGVTAFTFTVSLSAQSSQTITVSRQTTNGSASAPSDYTALGPATFTFVPGQTMKKAVVQVKGDVAVEPNETFFGNLSNATNATIADGQGKGTMLNDDLSESAPCTITGTNQNDVLNGTPGNDVICGRRGDDQIYGLDGADILKGERGNDLLVGGNGYDLLIGDVGIDDLRGESNNDTLRGGDNGDTLSGGANSDALFGEAGADSLNTQDGVSANDSADGGSETDSCVFDSGDFVTSCP